MHYFFVGNYHSCDIPKHIPLVTVQSRLAERDYIAAK